MRLFLVLLVIMNFSCNSGQEVSSGKNLEFYPQDSDFLSNKESFLKERNRDNSLFNLPTLLNGIKDSIEIRIWPSDAFDFQKHVFIFKIDSSGWHGYNYFSYTLPVIDQDGKKMKFADIKKVGDSVFLVKQIIPICGWKKFADSLNFFKIRTLPTQSLIENFKPAIIRDGSWVSFEIATNKSYRFITYDNPEDYIYEECRRITAFMQMLKRQLGNDYSWPTEFPNAKKSRN
jgi:hypothetical protein